MAEAADDHYPPQSARETCVAIQTGYDIWATENPSLDKAARAIGGALGIGHIAAAQAIALYRDWIS